MRMCNEYEENYIYIPHQGYDHYEDQQMQQVQDAGLIPGFFARSAEDEVMEEFRPVVDSTAAHKKLSFETDCEEDTDQWRRKPPDEWTAHDSLSWIAATAEAERISYVDINASALSYDGNTLLSFTKRDFEERDQNFGCLLYEALQRKEKPSIVASTIGYTKSDGILETLRTPQRLQQDAKPCDNVFKDSKTNNNNETYQLSGISQQSGQLMESSPQSVQSSASSSSSSDSEMSDTEVPVVEQKPVKRPPGRPPSNKTKIKDAKKTGRLWEFLRDLLKDPKHCPSVICWEDHDNAVFRFVKSENVAKIWGTRKGNEKMNYEKLSRAMRYYYKSQVLQPVLGRKLVYKFGPNAKGWRCDDPNFQKLQNL